MILFLFSKIFETISNIRNWLFSKKIISSNQLNVPVISVGNLTLGGTGKTPLVADIIQFFVSKHFKVGILSRGYKGNYGNQAEVNLTQIGNKSDSVYFGDEPILLKKMFPQVPIFVGANRYQIGKTLLNRYQVSAAILDDGFQHRKLNRNLDIVVLDSTAAIGSEKMFPLGKARESLCGLKRSDLIVLSKVNLTDSERLNYWRETAQNFKAKNEIFEIKLVIDKLRNFDKSLDKNMLQNEKVIAVCGIGNPDGFLTLLKTEGVDVVNHVVFKDHHEYTEIDWKHILSISKQFQYCKILVTSKDYVKMNHFTDPSEELLFSVETRLDWGQRKEEFDEFLLQILK